MHDTKETVTSTHYKADNYMNSQRPRHHTLCRAVPQAWAEISISKLIINNDRRETDDMLCTWMFRWRITEPQCQVGVLPPGATMRIHLYEFSPYDDPCHVEELEHVMHCLGRNRRKIKHSLCNITHSVASLRLCHFLNTPPWVSAWHLLPHFLP